MRLPGFIGGSAPSQSMIATNERTVNLYVERIGTEGTQHKTALFPSPGFETWCAGITDLGGRAGLSIDSHTWAIMGGGFYELALAKTATKKASLAQDSNLAQIVYNGPTGGQLCLASGTNAYTYVVASGAITTVLTGEATQIGMLDEYFLAINSATGKLRLSNLNDGLTWDPLQFAFRSDQPDPWQAMIVNAPDIILLGALTGSVWYDAGTSPFPLAARQGLTIPYGIVANFTLKEAGGVVFWLSQNKDGAGIVVKMTGYTPEPIMTPELAAALSSYQRTSKITDAEALMFQIEGHTWYVLRFPSANATWCYDLTTNAWYELGKWNSVTGTYDVWGPRMHVYAFGKHLTGDGTSGTIANMDITLATEVDGSPIRRLRRGPVLINENKRIPINRFELSVDVGVGLVSGQGSAPTIMGRFSADGGHTWGDERTASMGPLGQFGTRVYWTRMGAPRLWVAEVTLTDPVPLRIVDAFVSNAA